MATQFTDRRLFEYWEKGDEDWHVQYADTCLLLDAIQAVGAFAVRSYESPLASTTLNVEVSAGSFKQAAGTVFDYAGVSPLLLTASATNSIYLTDAGVLTVSLVGFPAGSNIYRI